MATIYQEFYCAVSGGGCGGFITFPLNIAINGTVEVVCPKCGHEHQRVIKNGLLTDEGRYREKVTQEITPTLAAWHKKAEHPDSMGRVNGSQERQAVVIEKGEKSRGKGCPFLSDLWHERFGDKR